MPRTMPSHAKPHRTPSPAASLSPDTLDHAVCVLANYRQFAPSEMLYNPNVESRMLLWCLEGRGQVTINRQTFTFPSGQMLWLPWRHAVRYEAAARNPFLLAGVHIIPRHAPGPSETGTRHGHPGERLDTRATAPASTTPRSPSAPMKRRDSSRSPSPSPSPGNAMSTPDAADHFPHQRNDADWPWMQGLRLIDEPTHTPLRLLAQSIVERWQPSPPDDWERRLQARLLLATLYESLRIATHGDADPAAASTEPIPANLRRLTRHLQAHLDQPTTLDDMAHIADCSASTVGRLFRRHFGQTPIHWLRAARIRRARELLATTSLRTHTIAQAVGMPDVPYFSKTFKQLTGHPPATYRRHARVF